MSRPWSEARELREKHPRHCAAAFTSYIEVSAAHSAAGYSASKPPEGGGGAALMLTEGGEVGGGATPMETEGGDQGGAPTQG